MTYLGITLKISGGLYPLINNIEKLEKLEEIEFNESLSKENADLLLRKLESSRRRIKISGREWYFIPEFEWQLCHFRTVDLSELKIKPISSLESNSNFNGVTALNFDFSMCFENFSSHYEAFFGRFNNLKKLTITISGSMNAKILYQLLENNSIEHISILFNSKYKELENLTEVVSQFKFKKLFLDAKKLSSVSSRNLISLLINAGFWSELRELGLFNFHSESIFHLLSNVKMPQLCTLDLKPKNHFGTNLNLIPSTSLRNLSIEISQSSKENLTHLFSFFPMLANLKILSKDCQIESFDPLVLRNLRKMEIYCHKMCNEEKFWPQLTQLQLLTHLNFFQYQENRLSKTTGKHSAFNALIFSDIQCSQHIDNIYFW